jgi:hypothetical protein
VIENPADYDNLATAPIGAGEPHTPPAEPLLGHDGKAWPETFDGMVWAQEFNRRFPAVPVDDAIGWMANAIMRGYDERSWKREEAHSSLPNLIAAAMAPGADMHELTGLPRDLGDERITFTDLQFLGFLGDALKFRLLTTVAGQPLDDTVDLRWDTLPMNAALLAGVVPALRTHVLKRAGLLDGSPDQVVLDEHGHPVEVQP